jgi:hypothetical protein
VVSCQSVGSLSEPQDQDTGAPEGTPVHQMCFRDGGLGSLVERASRVLAVALDFNFLFALGVLAVGAAVFVIVGNYTFAHRMCAFLGISHGGFPFLI